MKIKVILLQVTFIALIFCIRHYINIPVNTKEILGIVLLLGFSFGMCRYILKSKGMLLTSFLMGISLFVVFEVAKIMEFQLGWLPRYNDVPILISMLLSLVVILAYMCILYLICLFLKKEGVIR